MIIPVHFAEIDGLLLKSMWTAGFANLQKNISIIDSLNVFPVPDGDTGTNMCLTVEGGLKALCGSDINISDVDNCMQVFARGALMGARGNSGVIFSQFIKGIAMFAKGLDTFSIENFAAALSSGTLKAYSAVIKPTEGTMLTVMRETSAFAKENHSKYDNFTSFFTDIVDYMKSSLQHTPDLLPVLKEAGVVDSGGAGLLCVFEGMLGALTGESVDDIKIDLTSLSHKDSASSYSGSFNRNSQLEFGYCTEFILQLMDAKVDVEHFEINSIIGFLETIGSSIVAIKDEDIVKVHVHTFTPGDVINYCQRFGEYINIKIENMSVQHSESQAPNTSRKKYAVVAVCSGDGIKDYFSNIGVDYIIDGGQTQNPPMEDFIKAYNSVNADNIFVLPNNSNILLVAMQSADNYTGSVIHVVPTKSIAEGYSALSMMDLTSDTPDEVIADMMYAISNVSTALVTTAVRDTTYNGINIKKNQYIGLDKSQIYSCSDDKVQTAFDLITQIDGIENKEVLVLFYGENASEAEVDALFTRINEAYPLIETAAIYGGQNIYDFIMAIE